MTATILIIEDDADVREALAETLLDAGYAVVSVGNGEEALQWLETCAEPPSLMLLDLMMPVMDGWQFLAERESRPKVASIPTVVLSARSDMPLEHVVARLRKPIEAEKLLGVVGSVCAAAPPS